MIESHKIEFNIKYFYLMLNRVTNKATVKTNLLCAYISDLDYFILCLSPFDTKHLSQIFTQKGCQLNLTPLREDKNLCLEGFRDLDHFIVRIGDSESFFNENFLPEQRLSKGFSSESSHLEIPLARISTSSKAAVKIWDVEKVGITKTNVFEASEVIKGTDGFEGLLVIGNEDTLILKKTKPDFNSCDDLKLEYCEKPEFEMLHAYESESRGARNFNSVLESFREPLSERLWSFRRKFPLKKVETIEDIITKSIVDLIGMESVFEMLPQMVVMINPGDTDIFDNWLYNSLERQKLLEEQPISTITISTTIGKGLAIQDKISKTCEAA